MRIVTLLLGVCAFVSPVPPSAQLNQTAEAGPDGTLPLDHAPITEGEEYEEEANDGTLPLRLGNDGTLPLRLQGPAHAVAAAAASNVNAQLTLTQVVTEALQTDQGQGLRCELRGQDVSKHQAAGAIVIGGVSYQVRGICFDHATNNIEIVGERSATERTNLTGPLTNVQPSRLTGRMTVTSPSNLGGRYNVDLSRQ